MGPIVVDLEFWFRNGSIWERRYRRKEEGDQRVTVAHTHTQDAHTRARYIYLMPLSVAAYTTHRHNTPHPPFTFNLVAQDNTLRRGVAI